ncbi:MAG: hypothetical protein K5985_01900 [Lachnospiraceae bacterium]|nr:hypothetical protein [Lachnospiraceae bacterium]
MEAGKTSNGRKKSYYGTAESGFTGSQRFIRLRARKGGITCSPIMNGYRISKEKRKAKGRDGFEEMIQNRPSFMTVNLPGGERRKRSGAKKKKTDNAAPDLVVVNGCSKQYCLCRNNPGTRYRNLSDVLFRQCPGS